MMVTPRVTKEIRDHFSCQKLEGAELEDQGGEGTALTHWEKRVLEVSKQNYRIHVDWTFIFFWFFILERGNDGNAHTKLRFLADNAGTDGRLRVVQSKLQHGIASHVGSRVRL